MTDGFVKVVSASPFLRLSDCAFNAGQIVQAASAAAQQSAGLLVLPELSLTGKTCGDLFLQARLQEEVYEALQTICQQTANFALLLTVGCPVRHRGQLYNCAAVLSRGTVLGFVPKSYFGTEDELWDRRYFSPAFALPEPLTDSGSPFDGVPIGTHLLFRCNEMPSFTFGVEIGADIWAPVPPTFACTNAGATIMVALDAHSEKAMAAKNRRQLVCSLSKRFACGYVYANAAAGESTTDAVFAGHDLIAENGILLGEAKPFENQLAVSEVDCQRTQTARRRLPLANGPSKNDFSYVYFSLPLHTTLITRTISPSPFIPTEPDKLTERCETILRIQAAGLQQRLAHTGVKTALIGISGGLDSALALLVTARAFKALHRPSEDILAITMPGFGTTQRTMQNACELSRTLGASCRTIDITNTVTSHLADIQHALAKQDVVYENAQARMRTMILMDLANETNGLVVGTGDLSELALGWATYNGDHMCMYGVNASVPKTLIQHLIAHEAAHNLALGAVLHDILDTPVSPELLPPKDGVMSQQTEELVGPYELHDFFLYYMLRWGFAPRKIYRLASIAFAGRYDAQTILHWLGVFYSRFFSQQFKRSCLPDGPAVGSVTLSPRGAWHMPSDASAAAWLSEVKQMERQFH